MGWKLAEEVVAARPAKPGPEWWTLMDIAIDANDESRRAMPGEPFLALRSRCSRATLYRRLEALEAASLIKIVRRAGPGTRAVYEVLPLLAGDRSCLSVSETRSVDNPPP